MIHITNLKEDHLIKRVEFLNTKEVSNGVFISYPVDLNSTGSWFKSLNKNTRCDFTIKLNDDIIGFVGVVEINRINGTAELYIFIDPDNHGKGYGNKVINIILSYCKIELGLRKITLYVSSNNAYVINFYEKIGFTCEGALQKHVWFRGDYQDRYILSYFLSELDILEPIYEIIK